MSTEAVSTRSPRRIRPSSAAGFLLVHLAALGVIGLGFSWTGVAVCLGSYYLRMFAITAGFHRYFSHRTYRLARVPQFLLAFLGQTAAQKGVLWWASNHRHHHKYSDQPEDIHSPLQRGFWWSHMGWILSPDYVQTDLSRVPDLAKYPELRWLDRHENLPMVVYAALLFLAFGWTGLFYGYFLSTVFLWHGTFSINSLMHVFGRRVFATTDDSRNSFLLALVTMGEGWHNNHHWAPGSAAQGFRWWEVDATYYLLWLGERLRLLSGLHRPPERWGAAAVGAGRTSRASSRGSTSACRSSRGAGES
jgi:stearoyl-CoA desaturase (delta-9 desaturase)